MDKGPITLQSIVADFWQSCAEVIGRMDVTVPEGGTEALPENGLPILSQGEGADPALLSEAMPVLSEVLTETVDQMDHSLVGESIQRFDQLTGQTFTHTLESVEDALLGRLQTNDSPEQNAAPQVQTAVIMPTPVPLAQLTREAAMRFAQGAGFAQTSQEEALEKTDDEKDEEEKSSLSEKSVQKLIRLGRLKSF